MGEDASRVRKGHAPTNNATLNNIVLTFDFHCGFRYLPKVNLHFMMRQNETHHAIRSPVLIQLLPRTRFPTISVISGVVCRFGPRDGFLPQ